MNIGHEDNDNESDIVMDHSLFIYFFYINKVQNG